MPDWRSTAKLVRSIADNYKLPYYTISPTYSVCVDHGYLKGEHFHCPQCGKPSEVYSRITGYYRPVQNWNAGKTQEYKHRTEYVPEKNRSLSEKCFEHADAVDIDTVVRKLMLFTTDSCPNCKVVKGFMQKSGLRYDEIDAHANLLLAKEYDIRKVPTLVVVGNDNVMKIDNPSGIKSYTNKRASSWNKTITI